MINVGPKRFIECLLPVTACNLKCEYCYIIQENRRTNMIPELEYSPDHICKALRKERLGGVCYISICGAGETLIPNYIVDIVHGLLKEGHYVNITTNGTLTNRFIDIIQFDSAYLGHLHFSFSFHYLELLNKNLLDVFFNNVNLVKNAGCSILVQLNLYDGYIPHLNDIKQICKDKIGAYPQISVTRDETSGTIRLHTKLQLEDYLNHGGQFDSPLFDFAMENFNVKRNEFCYAGDWSFLLNLKTGIISKCYSNLENSQNIYENIDSPINFEAVGNNCKNPFCVNSTHFLSLGVIPSLSAPTYAALRNKSNACWYTKEMVTFLSHKLIDNNIEYTVKHKKAVNKKYNKSKLLRKVKGKIKRLFKLFHTT